MRRPLFVQELPGGVTNPAGEVVVIEPPEVRCKPWIKTTMKTFRS